MKTIPAIAALCAAASPSAALAEIPQPIQDMIDAAIASKEDADVATVIKLAKSTNPDDAAALEKGPPERVVSAEAIMVEPVVGEATEQP